MNLISFTNNFNSRPYTLCFLDTTLKKLKAELIRLNNTRRQKLNLHTLEQDKIFGENSSLRHLIKARKRQANRAIKKISHDQGITYTESFDIMNGFHDTLP